MSNVRRKPEDLIGKCFGRNLELQVVGMCEGSKAAKDVAFIVKCAVCSLDSELYGDGLFISKLQSIYKNRYPCGCNKKYRKSKAQYEVLINRYCAGKTYEFVGFKGDFARADSTVVLKCKLDGAVWTKWLSNLWQGSNCPCCAKKKMALSLRTDDEIVSRKLMSMGVFPEGTEFRRTSDPDEHISIWYVKCPVCSRNGEEFRTTLSGLHRGSFSCHCRPYGGFDKTKDGWFYVLRAVKNCSDFEFCGFGITTNLSRRIATHRAKLRKEGFVISELESYPMKGVEAFTLESQVKSSFPITPQNVEGFMTEATHYWLYDDVITFAENYISKA